MGGVSSILVPYLFHTLTTHAFTQAHAFASKKPVSKSKFWQNIVLAILLISVMFVSAVHAMSMRMVTKRLNLVCRMLRAKTWKIRYYPKGEIS